ncbi:hypothetical protein CLOM_g11152 [Closterium sp. NIES-68]|nr:hypothetical protein CLOM_g11152 [Closterium sp. NIES-68]GJP79575.1 hypothetical protein CLOP_g9795 [Closterium sp. NIES-67]
MACSPPHSTALLKGTISAYRPRRVLFTPLPWSCSCLVKGNDEPLLRVDALKSNERQQPSHVVARTSVRCDAVRQCSPRRQSQHSFSAGATARAKGTRSAVGSATAVAERLRQRKDGSASRNGEGQTSAGGVRTKGELDALETWLCGGAAHRDIAKGDGGKGASRQKGGAAQPLTAPPRAAQPRQQKPSGSDRVSPKTGQSGRPDCRRAADGRGARGGATHPAVSAQQSKASDAPRCRSNGDGAISSGGAVSSSSSNGCTKTGPEMPRQGRSAGESASPRAGRPKRVRSSYASLADAAKAGMTWIAGPEGVKIVGSVQRWRESEGQERRVLVEHAVVSLQLILPLSLMDISLRALWLGVCGGWLGAVLQVVARVGCWFSRLRAWCVGLCALRALHEVLCGLKARLCPAEAVANGGRL